MNPWNELSDAVKRGDLAGARVALRDAIMELAAKLETKMIAYKAARAESFTIAGSMVTFEIERHPGLSALTHKRQMWRVDTIARRIGCWDERPITILTEERVRTAIAAARQRPAGAPNTRWAAMAAADYVRERFHDIDDLNEPEETLEVFALAWAGLIAVDEQSGRAWRGKRKDVADALASAYAFRDVEERAEMAIGAAQRARALWTEKA